VLGFFFLVKGSACFDNVRCHFGTILRVSIEWISVESDLQVSSG
jgi:hypothetical protein